MWKVCLQTFRNNRRCEKLAYFLRTLQTSGPNNSRILRIENAKFSGSCFYMSRNDKPRLLKRYRFSCPVWLKITYKYLINIELVEFISFMVNFIDSMWPRCEFYSKKQLQSKTNFCSIFKEITTQWNSTTEYFSIFNIKVCNICTKS